MDPNCQKYTFLAFPSIEICTCSLVIEVSSIIIERGVRSVGCLTQKFFQRYRMEHDRKKISELLQ